MMIKRALPEQQIDLFDKPVLYLSQADVAEYLGVTVRMIQYWESNDLLHPERPQVGRQRRYTKNDLVEMQFIKAMIVDQGYTIPALKDKLALLQPPYYYNAAEMHWDITEKTWKSNAELAIREISSKKKLLAEVLANAFLDAGTTIDEHKLALAVLRAIDSGLKGRISKAKRSANTPSRRSRRKKTPADPLFSAPEGTGKNE
ncbi:MAG: MerR family transcriptional regulator [bacterium]|nr:MerR family transcriptional regulator [bacterium]